MKSARLAGMVFPTCCRLLLPGAALMASGLGITGSMIPVVVWAESSTVATADAPVDLSPGGNYTSGVTLRIPRQGWSFQVPAQWHATVFEDADLPFLISDEGRSMGMIFPLIHATAEEVENELSQPLSLSHGMVFVPAGTLMRTESHLRRSYVSEATVGRAVAVRGPSDQWMIYFLMGPDSESGNYDGVLDRLAGSTRFDAGEGGSHAREGI
jgi:hypothetical protein